MNPLLRMGIRANLPQFLLLVLVNALGALLAGATADMFGLRAACL